MKRAVIAIIILISAILTAWLLYPCGDNTQPRRVSLLLTEENRIITLPYRDYLAGCILGCAPPTAAEEALNAIACALNSRALYILEHPRRSLFSGADFSDDEQLCLPYTDPEAINDSRSADRAYKAADFGIAHALTYDGEIISAQICRYSTGMTDSGGTELPYLNSVAVPMDENLTDAVSTRAISAESVIRTLRAETGVTALHDDRTKWFSNAVYLPSGTLSSVRFGDRTLSGKQLQNAFGFRSAAITIEYAEERFVFTVKGWGSNLGMSINGAAVMAHKGASHEEILAYFYPESELTDL